MSLPGWAIRPYNPLKKALYRVDYGEKKAEYAHPGLDRLCLCAVWAWHGS